MSIKRLVNRLGLPRLIIICFIFLLLIMTYILDMDTESICGAALVRFGMNAVLVLAMVPPIISGVGMNFSSPIAIVAGLLGGALSLEWGLTGITGILAAMVIGVVLGGFIGWAYCQLLNRIKGSELMIGTYAGFSVVSLMCIVWLALPFQNESVRWPQGTGLRTIAMVEGYEKIFDNFLSFSIGRFTFPTGLLLVVGLFCLLMWLFLRSRTGMMMKAVGINPMFAKSIGVKVDKMRSLSMVLSSSLSAIGIVIYAQSYGFYQFYSAPLMMAFAAVAAILIGGATHKSASVLNVVVGTLLFQGMLTFALPITNNLLPNSSISEIVRIIVSNGIILYALTKAGEKK